jgi:hypothetical protein
MISNPGNICTQVPVPVTVSTGTANSDANAHVAFAGGRQNADEYGGSAGTNDGAADMGNDARNHRACLGKRDARCWGHTALLGETLQVQ